MLKDRNTKRSAEKLLGARKTNHLEDGGRDTTLKRSSAGMHIQTLFRTSRNGIKN